MLTHLGIWFFFGYVIHFFVVPLNKIVIPILGFPLGFYMLDGPNEFQPPAKALYDHLRPKVE